MSGHSKWSTIKHKKGAADARRGKLFTKLIREITVSARMGGGDPDANPRLRAAVNAARAANMPGENVDRAIKRGTGELEGLTYEEITYEGYGPGGAAVLLEALTDNRNRTVSEVRHLFSKYNGNMGESGCVGWLFDRVGVIVVPKAGVDEDQLMEHALEVGADDVKNEGDFFEVRCAYGAVEAMAEQLKAKGIEIESARGTMLPQNSVKLDGRDAEVMLRLYEALDDHDDIQHVWANFDIDDSILEKLA